MPESGQPILRYVHPATDSDVPTELSDQERRILERVNQKVAAADSLKDLVTFLFDATRTVCPCDRIGLAFVEEDGRRIRSYLNVTNYQPVVLQEGYSEDLHRSSLRDVIERGVPRLIADLDLYLEEHPDSVSTKLIVREGVRSNMTCPLSVDGRNVGVLFHSSRRPNAFSDHDIAVHQMVAERLGQAVDKAYRIEQLQAALHAYTEMLGFVSHELKSPVASMLTDASLLEQGYLGELNPKQREKLRRMTSKGEYLLGLVREYLDLARLEGGQAEPNFIPVEDFAAQVLEPAIEVVLPQIEGKSMTLSRELTGVERVTCDPGLLKIVLVNLLGNAAKYGRTGGRIDLRVSSTAQRLDVAVRNEGPGFPESQRSRLFLKFSRLDTPESKAQKGTGVGLYTCWSIVQLHGGRITARSDEGQYAEFSFSIPQPPGTRGSATS